ncbi:MFS transporter [Marinimicrobium sp. UBA4209]|uniref:MFS transporter n=1 Tax=Marinimicrobium sp. UBA4209 TaxID=1946810 RepID=UPI002579F95C|nr:MFS transporter [Marinimicrobium sp. UBA4209]
MSSPEASPQFSLLSQRRFLPLFLTQLGGAFNDNFYKSALLMLFTYGGIERWGLSIDVINNLVAATLIIPFLLFAPIAGQYADKFEKSRFIRGIKVAEIAIMSLGAVALWLNSAALLLLVLFLTGTQSACFSPLKYAILPQHLSAEALTGGNGLMHTGTSLAIFLGMIAGTLALSVAGGYWWVAAGALLVAWLGWRASLRIPPAPSADPELRLEANPYKQTLRTLACARENPMVFWCIIGNSWYWFLGSVYLTQLPNFTRSVLSGASLVVSLLLVLFLVGICIGALLCARLSRGHIEPALVPLGALLVLVFGVDLALAGQSFAAAHPAVEGALHPLASMAEWPRAWRVAADVLMLGVAGGLYVVPLTALIQERSRPTHRAQVIAAGNVINALFMVAAALVGLGALGGLGLSIPELFLTVAGLHVLLCIGVFMKQPEFLMRFRARFVPVRQ